MSVPFHLARHRAPIAVAVVLVIAGCGSSGEPGSPSKSASNPAAAGISFSSCMRSHGVPNFPDPTTSSGGSHVSIKSSSGINPASPAFLAAQKACGQRLPGGGSVSGKRSAATEAAMLAVSECTRAHGVSGFPGPTTTLPSSPAGYSGSHATARPSRSRPQSTSSRPRSGRRRPPATSTISGKADAARAGDRECWLRARDPAKSEHLGWRSSIVGRRLAVAGQAPALRCVAHQEH